MIPINRIAYYYYERDPTSADTVYHGLIGAWTNTATGDRFLRFPSDTGWSAVVGGTPFDLATAIHAATGKTTPVDADEVPIWNSVGSVLGKVTWANIKATLKSYFDGIYSALGHTHAHNDTTSKQGGTTNEYYHLTAAELAKLTAFPNKITVSATEPTTPSTGDLWVDIS